MVFLGEFADSSDISSVSSVISSSSDEEDAECETVDRQLQLPWHESYWSIKVTHVVSPNEVWGTLTKNAELLRRSEQMISMSTLKVAKFIITGEMYIVKRSNTWHRVKAIKSFLNGNRFYCDCFFIDIGSFGAIAYDDLFECVDQLCEIPPQAICFKLFGFDELYHCPHIDRFFSAWLMNKQFIGCLMMAQAQYKIQLDHGIKMPKVSIALFVFYPKFTLYKPILLKQIGESLPKPTFSRQTTNAKVSHVSPTGLVYFHLDEQSINYINALIQNFVSENQQLGCRFRHSDATNCLVLIYDIERNMYYRARITDVDAGSLTVYKCYFIDKGETRSIAVSNIFAVNENSILNYYPGQAVPAILHSLSSWDDTVYDRLNDILTNNTDVQVKFIDQKGPHPSVAVFKHSMNINELIRRELELHKYQDGVHTTFPDSMF